jgi:hypothetical protein
MSDRELVTFHVGAGMRDNIPEGDYSGFIEWMTVHLSGGSQRTMSRCMLHIERSEHPDLFSPNNSMTSMEIPVLAEVKKGTVTYASQF